MKKLLLAAAASMTLAGMAAPAFATDYLPFGPQENVALSTVLNGGWSVCYDQPMSVFLGNSASQALSACGTGKIMLAGRATGSDTLITLAEADYSDVFFAVPADDTTHNANGTEWYNTDDYSWGFAPGGQGVSRTQCDTTGGLGRICIHTVNGAGGYRIDNNFGLNESGDFEKMVFAFTGSESNAVPEPATWALMIGGFGMAGAALRRRRALAA